MTMIVVRRLTLCCAVAFVFSFGACGIAQFQPPTPDELKMTTDAKYPDAGAVYLNYEKKTDNQVGYESEYARIKILKESAKELATVHIPYWKGRGFAGIAAVSGRTIHADGTIVSMNVKPEDLMKVKAGETEIREMVFSLPSVEVGSIIEFYYQVRLKVEEGFTGERWMLPPDWEVQRRFPIRREHFVFRPLRETLGNILLWYTNLPGGQKLQPTAAGQFDLSVSDLPPLEDEKWAPPLESRKYSVIFYFSEAVSGQQYWQTASKEWLKEVDAFAVPSAALKQASASLITPGDSDLDRARKIYAAVQALDNTDFSRKKTDAERKRERLKSTRHAEDVWNQKSGDGQEIALLYLAMLKAAGVTAYPMVVVNRDRGIFNPDYLSFGQLDDVVVILSTDGKEIVIDPAEKMCPFQMVSWKHSGASGIRQAASGLQSWATPLLQYSQNVVVRRAELTVSPDGSVNGKLQFSMTGQEALLWRQEALRSDEDAVKKRFDQWLVTQIPSGVQAQVTHFAKLDDPSGDLGVYATVSGMPGTATSKRLLLPASFFSRSEEQGFIAQPDRKLPLDMHYAVVYKDGVLMHLPTGLTVESAPPASSIPWTGYAVYQIKSTPNGNDLTVTRTLARAFTLLQPEEYSPMRDFYQKVNTADQQQIVLTNSATAQKGN
jgi:transglutaminase-like putative cysteine protease